MVPWWLLIVSAIGGALFGVLCFIFVTANDYPEDKDE